MYRFELVHSGKVIASSANEAGAFELSINENVRVDRPGWLCVRVGGGGPDHMTHARGESQLPLQLQRSIMAHTSPVYLACGEKTSSADPRALEEILTLIERGRSYTEHRAAAAVAADVLHHHGGDHRQFLIRPFEQARAAVERKLRLAERENAT